MKINLIIGLLFFINISVYASYERSLFKIIPGKLHLGGNASSEMISTNTEDNTMLVRLDYEIFKKPLVPVPDEYLKGGIDQELPIQFVDERGYLELENSRSMSLPDAKLVYIGRADIGKFKNGHQVRIVANNGRSETDVFFHPELPELGWGKVILVIHTPLPILKTYGMEAVLKGL